MDYTDRSILGNVIWRVEARVVDDRLHRALTRFVKNLDDRRVRLYLVLLEALRPLSRQ